MLDYAKIEEKWIKKWQDAKIFEADANPSKEKFFVTFPYPYINAPPHIGHFYTIMHVEAFARYKRLQGFNVLFPQGWHATGSPIISAAKRVQEREEKQLEILRDIGLSERDIKKFEDPKYWVEYFMPEFKKDFQAMGLSIDWRRNFVTTSLNPYYDKFIQWQFNRLKEKGYVIKGKFPVVWCSKCRNAVSDHSRLEGEGETVQEFVLLKFHFGSKYIIAATLRPETVYGQTNLWVGPNNNYVAARVNEEVWIISGECAEKLKEQERNVEILETIKGYELIGKTCKAPGIGREIPILPSYFCETDKGTGIVTSVPSDAPDDYMGLIDLQNNEDECKKYGLNVKKIREIKPIAIINSPELGDMAAANVCNEMNIKSQHEKEKLLEAKKLVYKKGFYEGKMNNNCGKYSGWKVEIAKEKIKKELIENNEADIFYELTGNVVCRCLTSSIVKIVEDQWFIDYGNKQWKRLAHECLARMKIYPETEREHFNYVIEWLHKWACTREEGLGTRLPWDNKWLIESLSDSTIYMAYYTIAHLITEVPIDKVNDNLFDYIFLNKGKESDFNIKVILKKMKEEFNYWYPLDFRNSGKDLVQNHLAFFIFNHVAIFQPEKWPKSIGVNGWIMVDGQKMSKSLGNVIHLKEMPQKFGVDSSRLTILSGGEGLDDPNWDSEFAKALKNKIEQLHNFCIENYKKGRKERNNIDEWMESSLNEIIKNTTLSMEQTMFRSAIQHCYFDLHKAIKWYLRRTRNNPNQELMERIIEAQLIMFAPFAPFICEETWEKIGKVGFISHAKWPDYEEEKINPVLNKSEEFMEEVISDIKSVLKLVKIKPKLIKLFVAHEWKYMLFKEILKIAETTRNPNDIIRKLMRIDEIKQYGREIVKIVPRIINKLPCFISSETTEYEFLMKNKEFLEKEFGLSVNVIKASASKEQKASQAMPGKPAILVE